MALGSRCPSLSPRQPFWSLGARLPVRHRDEPAQARGLPRDLAGAPRVRLLYQMDGGAGRSGHSSELDLIALLAGPEKSGERRC